ncbi:DJ-1/PfpI family protein [Agromyces sp. Soil535]|uniref:DJ-1/PfpI family protein n=1 Tax=Agromyces sp. Soil535 TaxID=1736390 RepID=UPI0006FDE097|nr:DJ-1/PfpI family protein [Agromyces sp. Soil535]KRE21282.1 AraC family transcriptional regulator [Agromyces sp. Soil535]
MHAVLRTVVLVLAALALPAALGAPTVIGTLTALNAPRTDGASPPPALVAHDPSKPTAVVVVGDRGAVVSDTLAPYEILATTGEFNVYTVASDSHPVPLTGGLDLVPDLTFAGLENLLGGSADVVVVPAMPDVGQPTTKPVTDWLATQANGGALLLSVCNGAGVLASAGLLDGRQATAHWLRIDEFERRYPPVDWVRGTRYVDDGDVISTAGILSGIDGTLRVVERLIGADAAADAAEAIGWPHHHPGGPARMQQADLEASDAVAAFNILFGWDRPTTGVLLTDGVGEIELASVFDTYGQSLAFGTVAVGTGPVRSRHGLTFVPRTKTADGLDRLVVPGTTEHAAIAGPEPVHPHHAPGFPYDGVLQDLARTTDVATALWTAKVLEYPVDGLALSGPAWPWTETLRPIGLAVLGVLAALGVLALIRGGRRRPGREDPAPAEAVGER